MKSSPRRPSQIDSLLHAVPTLAAAVSEIERQWADESGGPGLHLYADAIWADLLRPALETNRPVPAAFFHWMEALAASDNDTSRDFLQWGLLEVMGDRADWLATLRRSMGPLTLLLSIETEQRWGRSPGA